MTLRRIGLGVGALLLALTGGVPTSARAVPAEVTCTGVWVVVDAGQRGDVRTGCAREHADGVQALRSAGFDVELRDGMICRIDGIPEACTITMTDYWSYWHAQRQAEGVGPWTYSTLGAPSYAPAGGDVEGWYFGDGGRVQPAALPDDHLAGVGSPAPTQPPASEASPAATPAPGTTSASPVDPGPAGTIVVFGLLAAAGLGWWFTRGRGR